MWQNEHIKESFVVQLTQLLCLSNQFIEVVHRTVFGLYFLIVGNVVAEICVEQYAT